MFRKNQPRRSANRRSQFSLNGRSLRYETMEGRLVLSASGFAGNECAPVLDDAELDMIVPTQAFSAQSEIAFQFSAADVVSDAGEGETAVSDIRFTLDPDIGFRNNGATPDGATLSLNDQGNEDVADDMWEFSWTPSATQIGTFRLFMIATDAGGTGGTSGTENIVPLSDVYAFELSIDNRPTVDLNGDDENGIDFGPVTFTEADDSTPISIVDSDLSIPFANNDMVASATIEIFAPQSGGSEVLAVTTDSSLVVDDSTPGRLVISVDGGGLANKSVFEDALRTLTYNNTSDNPLPTRTINVTINDGSVDSATATTTVNVIATNDGPDLRTVPGAPDARVGEEYTLDLVATDPDGGDLLVFRITSGPDGAVISPNGLPDDSSDNTIQVPRGTDGFYRATIRWTPTVAEGQAGEGIFIVSATDSGGLADAELYTIGIENQEPVANDDPTPGADPLAVGEDDGDTALGDILANDTDGDGDDIFVDSVSAGGSTFDVGVAFTHPTSGAVILVAENGQVNYNPSSQFESLGAGEDGTDTFEYSIRDENGNVSGSATVTVTINGENDAPTAVDNALPTFTISEDAGLTPLDTMALLDAATDVDNGDTLEISSAPINPTEGTFSLDEGVLSFDPNEAEIDLAPNETLDIDFMVTLVDGSNAEVMIPARITITGANDAPVAVDDPVSAADYTTDEDTQLTIDTRETGVLNNDTDDADNALLMVAEVNGDTASVGVAIMVADSSGRMGELTVSDTGTFTFNPVSGFDSLAVGESSEVTFTYRATDGAAENNLSNEATVTIVVTGVNDTPVANDVPGAADEDGSPVIIGFDGEDADTGDALTYEITSQPSEGTAENNDDGTFTFDPGSDFQDLAQGITRDVTFSYRAIDEAMAESVEATATITVTGVNDAPVFDLDNEDGLASTLPTGDLQSASVVAVELDRSSADPAVSSLNMVDIPAFTSDIDGDDLTYSLASGDNGGTPFPTDRPTLNASNQLVWNPSAADVGSGYVIRVSAQDQPAMGGAQSSSFDILVSVITGNPQVESVSPSIEVAADASEVTILFNEAMGASALVAGNYTVGTVDGNFAAGTSVTVLSATAGDGNSVVLTLSDPTLTAFSAGDVTRLLLTLDSQIADLDGNTLEGSLEFEINLIAIPAN